MLLNRKKTIEDKSARSRMLAPIAPDSGFIGAGIIFKAENNKPKRATTAADLWTISAFGVAIALNRPMLAISATVITLRLFSIHQIEWYKKFVNRLLSY